MHNLNPPHPGEILKHDCIEALGLTISDAARGLGVSRNTVSRILNAQSSVTPEMAVRLSMAFGSTPEMWLRMQNAYDLVQVNQRKPRMEIERFEKAVHSA